MLETGGLLKVLHWNLVFKLQYVASNFFCSKLKRRSQTRSLIRVAV